MKTGTLEVDMMVQRCEVWTTVRAVGMEAEPPGANIQTSSHWYCMGLDQSGGGLEQAQEAALLRARAGRRSQGLCVGNGSLSANQYQSISAF